MCSRAFAVKHGLQGQAVEIVGQSMRTDAARSFRGEEEQLLPTAALERAEPSSQRRPKTDAGAAELALQLSYELPLRLRIVLEVGRHQQRVLDKPR